MESGRSGGSVSCVVSGIVGRCIRLCEERTFIILRLGHAGHVCAVYVAATKLARAHGVTLHPDVSDEIEGRLAIFLVVKSVHARSDLAEAQQCPMYVGKAKSALVRSTKT